MEGVLVVMGGVCGGEEAVLVVMGRGGGSAGGDGEGRRQCWW